jgi:signal transduction histidine kinase
MIRISLKNKLSIGFGFLLIMIILLWIIGGLFIYDLSERSAAMLKENYQTIELTKMLNQIVDNIKNQQMEYFFNMHELFNDSIYNQDLNLFQKYLTAVGNNITEPGEQELTAQLRDSYESYIKTFDTFKNNGLTDPGLFFSEIVPGHTITRDLILSLSDMNMDAISHKNNLLKNSAYRAFIIISFIGTICFIISALFFFRYPRNIARPMHQLIQGIKEIANRNYEQKLLFKSNDELGELAEAFNLMAAKLNEYEHSNLSQLLFEKKRIDTIINNMKDAIIGLNEKKEIIFSNTIACRLLDVESTDIVGKYAPDVAIQNETMRQIIKDILNGEYKSKHEFSTFKIYSNGKPDYYTKEILDVEITRTGENRPVNVGAVIIMKNITHFLEQDEAKTNFISTISHELKTPISSLKLNLKLLDDKRIGTLNDEQKNIVEVLKQETHKMLAITSELLDLAQVESGNIRLEIYPVHPIQILEYVMETSNNRASQKQISIEYESDPDLPPVFADSEKTAWVLLNLINNSIQYSEPGSRVIVSVRKEKDQIVFKVQDFGKGIEEKYLDKIFEKFFRIPGSAEKGTGLGLTISKEFISKQRGKIWVESKPGAGSMFYFNLPAIVQ